MAGPWEHLRLYKLDPHDLVVSKLRRFHARDRADVAYLCDAGLIDPATLAGLFDAATPYKYKCEDDSTTRR